MHHRIEIEDHYGVCIHSGQPANHSVRLALGQRFDDDTANVEYLVDGETDGSIVIASEQHRSVVSWRARRIETNAKVDHSDDRSPHVDQSANKWWRTRKPGDAAKRNAGGPRHGTWHGDVAARMRDVRRKRSKPGSRNGCRLHVRTTALKLSAQNGKSDGARTHARYAARRIANERTRSQQGC